MHIIGDTTMGTQKKTKMAHLAGLIEKTQGDGVGAILQGVLMDTKPSAVGKVVDSVQKDHQFKSKTNPRKMGMVPYSGKMY